MPGRCSCESTLRPMKTPARPRPLPGRPAPSRAARPPPGPAPPRARPAPLPGPAPPPPGPALNFPPRPRLPGRPRPLGLSALSCWRLVAAGRLARPELRADGAAGGCRRRGCPYTTSARGCGEQLVHFHVMRLTDSLFLWVGATPHLRNLAVAMCTRYVSAAGGGEGQGGEGAEAEGGGREERRQGRGRRQGEGRRQEGAGVPAGAGGRGPGAAPPRRGLCPSARLVPSTPHVSGWVSGPPWDLCCPLSPSLGRGWRVPGFLPAFPTLTAFAYVSRTRTSLRPFPPPSHQAVTGVPLGAPDPRPPLPADPATSHLPHLSPGPRHRCRRPRSPFATVCQSCCNQGPQPGELESSGEGGIEASAGCFLPLLGLQAAPPCGRCSHLAALLPPCGPWSGSLITPVLLSVPGLLCASVSPLLPKTPVLLEEESTSPLAYISTSTSAETLCPNKVTFAGAGSGR